MQPCDSTVGELEAGTELPEGAQAPQEVPRLHCHALACCSSPDPVLEQQQQRILLKRCRFIVCAVCAATASGVLAEVHQGPLQHSARAAS